MKGEEAYSTAKLSAFIIIWYLPSRWFDTVAYTPNADILKLNKLPERLVMVGVAVVAINTFEI